MTLDLSVHIANVRWPTPVALASGTCGYGVELDGLIDWQAVGAIFTKGLSLEPRQGNPPPRIWETPSGMLNAIGLENIGVDAFERDKMPFLRKFRSMHGGKVYANLFATSIEEYIALTKRLDAIDGVDGIEVNLSCPNVSQGGMAFGRTAKGCFAVTQAVRGVTQKSVAVKLTPQSMVQEVAKACADAGADILTIANTMPAMAIDVHRRRPQVSHITGGLSGAALRPITVRMTYEARGAVDLPIIGIGGVATGEDAAEYLLAGASAVQIGTATFADPNTAKRVHRELETYLLAQGATCVSDVVGALELSQ